MLGCLDLAVVPEAVGLQSKSTMAQVVRNLHVRQ